MVAPAPTRRFPERIGRYEVLLPIASGGMATVFLARATSIGGFEREVAIKVMHPHLKDDPSFAADLLEEAKLTVRIRHPNVVSVIDVGEDPFGLYLVMDYVEGDTLGGIQKRAEAALPARLGLKLLIDALAGLHAAHELKDEKGRPGGVVHRDFSPQNILVGADGIGRLTDFGIAKAATRITNTSTGIIKGKVAYMSPEQAAGDEIDRRTDVWAAGVVAWQLVAGRHLHSSQRNDPATLLRVATRAPPRLCDVKPDVPPEVDAAVAKALAMDVDDRWPTAQAFRQALLAACRASDNAADTDEVAAFVTELVEPALAERRRRVAEVDQLREKLGRLRNPSDPGSRSTPHSDVVEDITMHTVVTGEAHTDTTSASEPRRASPQRRRITIAALAGAGVALAVGVGLMEAHRAMSSERSVVATSPSPSPVVAPSDSEPADRPETNEPLELDTTPPVPPPVQAGGATGSPARTWRGRGAKPHVARPSAPAGDAQAPHSLLPESPYRAQP